MMSAIYGVIYLLVLSLIRNGLSLYAEVLGAVESEDAFADHREESLYAVMPMAMKFTIGMRRSRQ